MYQTAELTSLLRTLAIIVLIYYGYKVISRYLFPKLMGWAAKKAQQKFQDQVNKQFGQSYNSSGQKQDSRAEGDVKIDYVNKKAQNKKDTDYGEYVEFEEVE